MADDADAAETIEWGGDAAPSGQQRLTAVLDAPGDRNGLLRQANPYALGCALGGFIALLGAQYLPWAHVNGPSASTANQGGQVAVGGLDITLSQVNWTIAVSYHLTLALVLAAIGVAVAGPLAIRRTTALLALGLAGGQVALLVSVAREIQVGSLDGQLAAPSGTNPVVFGPGFSIAALATVLLLAAAIFATQPPRRRREPDAVAELDAAPPLDLTVTQVESATQWEATR
jgi:hypothetical protein